MSQDALVLNPRLKPSGNLALGFGFTAALLSGFLQVTSPCVFMHKMSRIMLVLCSSYNMVRFSNETLNVVLRKRIEFRHFWVIPRFHIKLLAESKLEQSDKSGTYTRETKAMTTNITN